MPCIYQGFKDTFGRTKKLKETKRKNTFTGTHRET